MGRATRKGQNQASRRTSWSWVEEDIPPGTVFSGRGRDGRVFLCQDGDTLLSLGEGIDWELPGPLEPDTFFVASGEDLFALSGKDIFAMYGSDESARYKDFIHGEPLALLPTADGMRIIHRDENEGILQNDFSEYIVSPEGDYVLAPWQGDVVIETLEAPGGGGVALARKDSLLYDGPVRKEWPLPLEPGWIVAHGDPHDPSLFVLDRSRRSVFIPDQGIVDLPGAARGWDGARSGQEDIFIASVEDRLQRIEGGKMLPALGPYEDLQGCRILPGRKILMATERGLLFTEWDGSGEEVLSGVPCQDIELAICDEAEAEILLDGTSYIRGELE